MSTTTMSKVQDQCQHLVSTLEVSDISNGIIASFRALRKEPNNLDIAVNYLYETLLDDATIGICMETHHLQKTGILPALDGIAEVPRAVYQMPNFDIFGIPTEYKSINCPCPNCDRMVAAARFAPHLQSCMGLGRSSSRTALRRRTTSFCSSGGDFDDNESIDDDNDVDWSMDMHKKKSTKTSRNNAGKKINDNNFY